MKIRTKIFLIVSFLAILGVGTGLFFTNYIIRDITVGIIGRYNVLVAENQMKAVDRIIYRRLERWESYTKSNKDLITTLESSNQKFSQMPYLDSYIQTQDQAWQSAPRKEITPFMRSLIDTSLADGLRSRIEFYNKKYNYRIFPEFFITNKYGAIIAETAKTTDYNQADEDWWQETVEQGLYVGDVSYDESTKSDSLVLSIRIEDEQGNFLGVAKITYDIKDILDVVNEIKDRNQNKSVNAYLLDSHNKLIYSISDGFGALAVVPDPVLFFSKEHNEQGYKLYKSVGVDKLFAHGHSFGYSDFKGLGWSLIISYDTREVLSPLDELNYNNFLAVGLIGLFVVILLIFIYRLVLVPLKGLSNDALIIKSGNLDHYSSIKSKDEIGDLARAFNSMIDSVKRSRTEIDRKVEEQTREISNKARELEEQKIAILNILDDVEKQKVQVESLARDLQKFRLAVDDASDHIVITDSEGIILYANKAVEKITGFKNEEILGKKAGDGNTWGGLMEHSFYVKLWQIIKTDKKSFVGEINNRRKSGENYTVLASISPVLDQKTKEVKFFVGIERDITKEKQVDKAKTEFVSLASHQLRTPLSTIRWYVEMILSGDMGKVNDKQRKYIEEIDNANQRMIDLVNALLNTSRIELGTFTVEPELVDPKQIIRQALEELQEKVQKKNLIIKDDSDPNIPLLPLDPRLTHIIFQNLLSNATKYTLPGGSINWAVKLADPVMSRLPPDRKYILIKVADTGVGIPPEAIPRIYEKLYRADNVRNFDPDGTGLGLYLTKSIVDSVGGQIWFDSVVGRGTTFYVALLLAGMKKRVGSKMLEPN
ncbi:MAG TPA: ATP-binding protein [Candidatus Paceibacterota bacterium]|nr:ATP-binding protein [Candidatus Paceibacterota bacterium]